MNNANRLADDGFSLMTNDPWYNAHPTNERFTRLYRNAPPATLTRGKTNRPSFEKRDGDDFDPATFDPEDVWVDEGNSKRKATDEELLEDLGLLRCENGDCDSKLGELGVSYLALLNPNSTVPIDVVAAATPFDALPRSLTNMLKTASSIHDEAKALITPAPQLEYVYDYEDVEYED